MDVKEAVVLAKQLFMGLFEAEVSEQPTLEEVWFDSKHNEWCVTLGVRRSTSPFAGLQLQEYKTVRVSDADGRLVAIRNREFAAAQ